MRAVKRTGRLHLRVEQKLLSRVRKLANKNGVTLTLLVEAGLRLALDLDDQQERLRKQLPAIVDADPL